jgi:DNA-binding NtrC family response regulator
MNPKHTILYVGRDLTSGNPIFKKLKASGFNLVSASRNSEALAKLFANSGVEAIVLDQRATDKLSLGLAKFVKSFRAAVPVILLSTQLIEPLPRCIDAGVCIHDELGGLVPTIEMFLDGADTAI